MQHPVTVTTRAGTFDGRRAGDVARFDWEFEVDDGTAVTQPVYLLLDRGIQLNQPVTWTGYRAGWWYVDVAAITVEGDRITVVDLFVDFLVPPTPSTPYRVLDLEELADALTAGRLQPTAVAEALRRAQDFVDTYLHRRGEDQRSTWKDFPPSSLVHAGLGLDTEVRPS